MSSNDFYLLKNEAFLIFTLWLHLITFNTLVPVITYVIAAINSKSLTISPSPMQLMRQNADYNDHICIL